MTSEETTKRVLLTGANGFIGSACRRALFNAGIATKLLLRQRPERVEQTESVVVGDLRDPRAQLRALRDVDAIIHCASYTGPDTGLQKEINSDATRNLVRTSRELRQRFLYVSTTGVYGLGPHRQVCADTALLSPSSSVSWTRLEAEKSVRSAGGQVIRPNLVLGVGDTWVVPGIVHALASLGAPDKPSPLLSVILVDQLALLIASIACNAKWQPGRAHHGCLPRPVSVADITVMLGNASLLREVGRWVHQSKRNSLAQEHGFSAHQVSMLYEDNQFESQSTWTFAGVDAPLFDQLPPSALKWYRDHTT